MVTSHNFPAIQRRTFPSASADSCLSQSFAHGTQTLTAGLYNSLAGSISPSPDLVIPESICSEPETALKCLRSLIYGPSGGVSKQKSRASRRTQTTFITVDRANFQQMVQQVTGVRMSNLEATAAPILKAEPQRKSRPGGGCFPTLDTSALYWSINRCRSKCQGATGLQRKCPMLDLQGCILTLSVAFPP